jgi:hypothetical protein
VELDPDDAMDTGEALDLLLRQQFGPWLLGGVALGLFLYGIFSITMARYRRIEVNL